jgi:hypothetical protein
MAPSTGAPNTLGWRGWRFARSPVQRTPWYEHMLRAEEWSDSDAVRGQAGIRARLVSNDWRRVDPSQRDGIVERFGRYSLTPRRECLDIAPMQRQHLQFAARL